MTALILAFQATIWLVIGYLFVLSRNASIFHPFSFYLAFHGIAFVIRPIMEHAFGFEWMTFVCLRTMGRGVLMVTGRNASARLFDLERLAMSHRPPRAKAGRA